ncbi:hypothetical protein MLD38_020810 [Melastoma candidum]|uniref:Uncharacterized protein n=1 Tax=Melastoma candidum TaxID=119954 RepID=A0ACB9QDG7_9MYRT|nr:hypothetical protein MLD38_020810 [Melastoma candidum]
MADWLTRIAVVNPDKCKPKKCRQECKKGCPVVTTGNSQGLFGHEIVTPQFRIASISEELCIGCGICVKVCIYLDKDTTHRYGANLYKLRRLPVPRPGQVLGLVGTNGIGKSTALKILAGKLKPNLGRYDVLPDWQEIFTYFRGSELQNYFTRMLEDNLKAILKPQYVDHVAKSCLGKVGTEFDRIDERGMKEQLCVDLELNQVLDRNITDLSGGELPRFSIAIVVMQNADIYMFDEPSSYLDVKQKLNPSNTVIVQAGLRWNKCIPRWKCPNRKSAIRDEALTFKVAETPEEATENILTYARYKYPTMTVVQGEFKLKVVGGEFMDSQIIVMHGENGTGKTTFIRTLVGLVKPDSIEGDDTEIPEFIVSYKRQELSLIRHLLHQQIPNSRLRFDETNADRRTDGSTSFKTFWRKTAKSCNMPLPRKITAFRNESFLIHLDITFRRDPTNFCPRINKLDSTKDKEQKAAGSYYYLEY